MNKLTELFQPRCKHRHTAKTHPHCFENGKAKAVTEQVVERVLVLDVETLPLVGYAFNPWSTDITLAHLIKDFCILSYSAKWLGDDKIISDVLTPKEAVSRNDKRILQGVWKLLEKSTVVVTHNGKRFDMRKLNARFWENKMGKPSSYKVIDTLVEAKKVFGLTYNSVTAIAKLIGADKKLDTSFGLWAECDNGVAESLQYMREYNEQDVYTQEEIYVKMRGWIENHPDLRMYNNLVDVCPACLGGNHEEIGLYYAKNKKYVEHRCADCGSVWHDSKAVKE